MFEQVRRSCPGGRHEFFINHRGVIDLKIGRSFTMTAFYGMTIMPLPGGEIGKGGNGERGRRNGKRGRGRGNGERGIGNWGRRRGNGKRGRGNWGRGRGKGERGRGKGGKEEEDRGRRKELEEMVNEE